MKVTFYYDIDEYVRCCNDSVHIVEKNISVTKELRQSDLLSPIIDLHKRYKEEAVKKAYDIYMNSYADFLVGKCSYE